MGKSGKNSQNIDIKLGKSGKKWTKIGTKNESKRDKKGEKMDQKLSLFLWRKSGKSDLNLSNFRIFHGLILWRNSCATFVILTTFHFCGLLHKQMGGGGGSPLRPCQHHQEHFMCYLLPWWILMDRNLTWETLYGFILNIQGFPKRWSRNRTAPIFSSKILQNLSRVIETSSTEILQIFLWNLNAFLVNTER